MFGTDVRAVMIRCVHAPSGQFVTQAWAAVVGQKEKESQITPTPKGMGLGTPRQYCIQRTKMAVIARSAERVYRWIALTVLLARY